MVANEIDARYQVRSVSRAIEILESLEQPGDGLTVTEVARRVSASKSAAFSTLQTLEMHGFVSSQGEGTSRRYRLGLALARLGEHAVAQVSLREVAGPVLRELSEETGMSSRVAVPEEGFAVIVGRVDAPGTVRFDLHMGHREPPHCTGLGKAMASAMPEDRLREIVERVGLPQRTSRTITDLPTLLADLAEVRRRGYAVDDEEDAEGIFCVGAPVHDHRGQCAGAVSVTGLKLDLPAWRIHQIGESVRTHAERITGLLGGRQ
ncbi:IclR family transcriptional regulator [Nonomuraea sp. NPDC046570]|uniref:IclR family transcriptional regulator n=1 Tax=Nonomuraea sp. NPDC046570 TaxID=3155255 RepID=UPI0033EDF7B4